MKQLLKTSLIMLVIAVSFSACKKEEAEDVTVIQQAPFFSMEFYKKPSTDYIDVNFAVSNFSTLPTVMANDIELKYYQNLEANIAVAHGQIPITTGISYSISSDGKTTSGSINMPDAVDTNFTCNGVSINSMESLSSSYVNVNSADSYTFKWTPTNCDFQIQYLEGASSGYSEFMASNIGEIVVNHSELSSSYLQLQVTNQNGTRIQAGANPNATGDYGKGFVYSTAGSKNFNIQISGEQTNAMYVFEAPNKNSHVERFKAYLRKTF